MNKQCTKCQSEFQITESDQKFYDQINVPSPTLCADCRFQRRLVWRNERNLYKRKCDFSGEEIISVFAPEKDFVVYKSEHWYGGNWDAKDYGRDYDFSRPFFEQFAELLKVVPQVARSVTANENCDYINQAGWCKDCYLVFEADYNRDCMYSSHIRKCNDCVDVIASIGNTLCYECIDCNGCYNLRFSQDSQNCSDSWFLKNCIGVKNSFGSVNLRNKEYYFLNQPCTKEEYFQKLAQVDLSTYEGLQNMRKQFQEHVLKFPQKASRGTQNEDSTGNYLYNTQRVKNSNSVSNSQDCKNLYYCHNMKNCHDITIFGADKGAELCYEGHEIGEGVTKVLFSDQIWSGCHDISYSKLCVNGSNNLFGCVGMQKSSYCILNKQYTKEEYEELVPKIIEHMKSTGEYGEFFPAWVSPFSYNETNANDIYKLDKGEAVAQGFKWRNKDERTFNPPTCPTPKTIQETSDSIVNEILKCIDCNKNYKIIQQELKFYRKQSLPIPNKCHDCRHQDRWNLRNLPRLFKRSCQKCNIEIQTSYPPQSAESPDQSGGEIVYCEKCYLGALN